MKVLLVLFSFVFLTGSAVVAVGGFFRQASLPAVTPLHFIPLLNEGHKPAPVSSKALERVHRYKRFLDSLGFTETGQAQRENLLRSRPHLMDTLNYLESIYTNEIKNETYGKDESKN